MLSRCELIINENGLLFIVLPLACIQNSRYIKHGLFLKMLKTIGFTLESHKTSEKLVFYIFKRTESDRLPNRLFPRKLCRGGKERNSFSIVIE